jgi:membrane protease YdiL (CAAX protease family)
VLSTLVKVGGLPLDIPVTDLVLAFMPLTAAVILVYREEGPGDARMLLKRVFDYKRIKQKIWYVPIVLLAPLLFLLIYGSMRLLGRSLPAKPRIPFLKIPFLFILFFALAIGEEIGWTGYATDSLQERWSALTAGIILGLVSMLGHYPSMIEQGRSLAWIAWSTFGITGWRTLAVWLYNNTGRSVFAVILFHAMTNVCRAAFPTDQTHNPLVDYPGVHYSILAIAAVVVTFLWAQRH